MEFSELAARLVAAALAGAAIGVERELRLKAAGLRTHTLVALGSAAFLLLATSAAHDARIEGESKLDVLRVLGALISGTGFLAAGVILEKRGNVHGLTTAAGLWIAAALGAAAGMGQYAICLLAGGITLLVLWPIHIAEKMLSRRNAED